MASIMVQGTASSAGKSLMAAALCRIFKNDGFKVYPFKSQNMSLNSYVTKEGLEMGRAQVLQAYAAGIEPSVDMNPILLKPSSDKKSQVIVMGKPINNLEAVGYFTLKKQLKTMIEDIYKGIEKKSELVVIEGAGSPAEINLNADDFVNMGMAKIADAPVLLVADIDRGGVFASIYGTIMLLKEEERNRIKGIIINKFRGDKALLYSGLEMIEDLVKIPVVGVIPYMYLKLDEEDGAVEFSSKNSIEENNTGNRINENISTKQNTITSSNIDICILHLPHMSNFTDFDAFRFEEDVTTRYVQRPEEIGMPEVLIIPGSKNTIEDLRWLKRNGFMESIKSFKGVLFGICGGYQMLGKNIIDIEGWEVKPGDMEEALGVFNTITEFRGDKITKNVTGYALGKRVYGYEIHAGKTIGNINPFVKIEENNYMDGDMLEDRVFGTYLHGIFDSAEFREKFLNNIRVKKNLAPRKSTDLAAKREEELEKLASIVRENLDMEYIYSLIGR